MPELKKLLIEAYLDYFNNYLTVDFYAEVNNLTLEQAWDIISIGRRLHCAETSSPTQ